ncbi:MAG TPA: hypothetical protein DCQ06_13005 [Myxococcales bacterium]|nr:hypothetical protein [Myxococcales bacterium]HAN32508.1 hypothetical protein [Myxococcales bacterium]
MVRHAINCVLLAWLVAGCSDTPPSTGQADYQRYCALCHGEVGQGYLAPRANALTNEYFLAAANDEFFRAGIIRGRPGTKMSAWGKVHGGPLNVDQADGIIDWLRTFETSPRFELDESPLQGDLQSGQQLWQEQCAGCHGEKGGGGLGLSVQHPIFLETVSDGFLRVSIALGRPGTAMPGYEEQLSASQIDSLVRAIRAMEALP